MQRTILIVVCALAVLQSYECVQVQMQETGAFVDDTETQDLESQVTELRRNVSDLWSYLNELRSVLSQHLNHLRQHQVQLENSVHELQHHSHGDGGEAHTAHSDDHHHSGEHHSHSDDSHSHGSDDHHSHGSDDHHSHGSDDHHSHGSDDHHSHGSDDHHSHGSDDHHSHGSDDHHHSGEQHSHDDDHSSHSSSHSHTSNDFRNHHHSGEHTSHGDGADQHQDHKDSHETEDLSQQSQQPVDPLSEPVVLPTTRQEHYHHHHHHSHSQVETSSKDPFNLVDMHPPHRHHGHGSSGHAEASTRNRNSTVTLPKYSEYSLYNIAICRVQPNRGIPEDKQQNVQGQVSMWQKKSGGPLNIHVRLQGFEVGNHHDSHNQLQQQQQQDDNDTPAVGHRHGFHVHSAGDLSNGCQSTGSHYNPKGVNHGSPQDLNRHVGDLGNIECDEHGVTNIVFSDDVASLRGPNSIFGKSLVIHENTDDLGLGGDAKSLMTGNAGTRIACCVIERVEKLSIRTYRIIKTATQYQNR